jgi:hypothetical protein
MFSVLVRGRHEDGVVAPLAAVSAATVRQERQESGLSAP